MPAKAEKDSITGVETTGHEWDGIRELNNPLPKWWLYVFYATIVFAVVWWILYPAWPWVHGHTTGILHSDQRTILGQDMEAAHARQAAYLDRIAAQTPAQINADAELQRFAIAGGEVLFKENCAPCHGLGGAGRKGYPTLADDDWLWGGTLEQIDYTIHHGIRNGVDPDARDSQMPAFGADGILTRPQIEDVAQHVLSLTGRATDQAAAGRGRRAVRPELRRLPRRRRPGQQGGRRPGAERQDLALRRLAAADRGPGHPPAPRRDADLAGPAERQRDQDADHLRPRPGRGAVGAAGR